MNEQQNMIANLVDGLFSTLGTAATMPKDWACIDEVALPSLLLREDCGGIGGSWSDALIVFRLAGYHALALPVVEAMIAAALAGTAERRGTIASLSEGTIVENRFSGTISNAPWVDGAAFVLAPSPIGGTMLLELDTTTTLSTEADIAGDPRSNLLFSNASATPVEGDVFKFGALARTAQIAGALDAALALSVGYANERHQFGRPLAKFQAVQQSLATFACEAAAANVAVRGAAEAIDRDCEIFQIAAAKLRANQAVGVGTALAHQVHGAIGFTSESGLHPLTRRLWAWRSEFGGDAHWARVLGERVCARGADTFWADLTDISTR